MRVSYPLSLKVSLWLMLNLLLLAALGIGFFTLHGGLGWSALVAGPTGDRAQELFNLIAGEAAVANGEARNAVLTRFGAASNAEFYLFAADEKLIAGPAVDLPPAVRERMEFRGAGWAFPGGPGGPGGPGAPGFGGKGPGMRGDLRRGPDGESDPGRWRDLPPAVQEKLLRERREARESHETIERTRFGPVGAANGILPSRATFRFIARTDSPAEYWIGMRVPFAPTERAGRMVPAKMVARVGSFWGMLSLLGIHTWLLAGGGVLALSVVFWLPLVSSITRSLGQLTTATEKIAEGHFDTRVASRRRDEIGQLGDSVNRMAARLDAHMNGQKRFLGDVAHELCSPLARLQMATGILADQAPKNLQPTVADLREEVQQMSTLVNELLAFTKAGLQPRAAVLAATPLETLAREVLTREDTGNRVTLAVAADLQVMAEKELLGRALANLVRNALRYAGDAGPITLAATRDGNRITIVVEDEGPGVPAGDLDRLGEPFFRPELARTREGGGVGLGLAIVRTSVAACGGGVRFANRTPHGFRAEVGLAAA